MKAKTIYILYVLLCLTLVMAACSSGKEKEIEIPEQGQNQEQTAVPVEAPLSLCLPAGETLRPQSVGQRRVMGDPGQTENFLLPRYVYIFLLRQTGAQWTVYEKIEDVLDAESWKKQRYRGSLQTTGDSIYLYTRPVTYMLDQNRFNGRAYAVMSARRLTFDTPLASVETLDDVLNLRFDVSPDSIQQSVQHIYTSPYNYETNGQYYGSYSSIGNNHPTLNLMLYHVAAKVDLKWNVADTARIKSDPSQAVRLTSLSARRLYNGWSYVFRPMENTVESLPTSGYEINDIVTPSDEGLWWEGRYYFYTIPYHIRNTDYFPLQLVMRTNNLSGDGYRVTINQPFDPTSPFAPWVRADLRLSRPLGNTTATFTVGE